MSVPSASAPSNQPGSSPSDDALEQVRADLAAATERVESLEREHRELLDDPGVIQEDRDATALLLASARTAQAAARAAVDRIGDGSYGRCLTCGNEIPAERLEAVPETTHCMNCSG